MKTLKFLGLAALLALGVACGGKKDGKGGDSPEAVAKQLISVMGQFADAVDKNKDDCTKMAAAADKILESNKALFAKAKKLKNDPEVKKDEKLNKMVKDEMGKLMPKLMGGMMKCGQDPAMKPVNDKFKDIM